MKELFQENGHLTGDAFELLKTDELSELERLEISEHLSFCDPCIEEYMDCLSKMALCEPMEPMTRGVLTRIRHRGRLIFMSEYGRAAIAVSIAMIFWVSGFFNVYESVTERIPLDNLVTKTEMFTQNTVNFTKGISKEINNVVEKISEKGVLKNEKK